MKSLFFRYVFALIVAIIITIVGGQTTIVEANSFENVLEKIVRKKPVAERASFISKLEKALPAIQKNFEIQKDGVLSIQAREKTEKTLYAIDMLLQALPNVKEKVLGGSVSQDLNTTVGQPRVMKDLGIRWVYFDQKRNKGFGIAATADKELGLYEISTDTWEVGKKHEWDIISNGVYFDYDNEIIYAGDILRNRIDKYDLRTHSVESINVSFQPYKLEKHNNMLYISAADSVDLYVVDPTRFSRVETVTYPGQKYYNGIGSKQDLLSFGDTLYTTDSSMNGYTIEGDIITDRNRNINIGEHVNSIVFGDTLYVHSAIQASFQGGFYPIDTQGNIGDFEAVAPRATPATIPLGFTKDGRYYIVAYRMRDTKTTVFRMFNRVIKYDMQLNKIVDSVDLPEELIVFVDTTKLQESDYLVPFYTIDKDRNIQTEFFKKIDFSGDMDQFLDK